MGVFENKSDGRNLDLDAGYTLEKCLEITDGFKSELPKFKIKSVEGFYVVDEGYDSFVGAKTRFGEFFVSQIEQKEIVYCQPATGLAGASLCHLAKKFNKKLTLFMPARKVATKHQLYCIENGADPVFKRIAAMPVLQGMAKRYAEENNAMYIPFGLKHPLVAAGGVRAVYDGLSKGIGNSVPEMWTVTSTGVLTRVLQIAFPNTEFHAVAVARNMQPGELGRAKFYSYHKAFTEKADIVPEKFDTVDTYDAKGWEYMKKYGNPGSWFFNVARDVEPVSMRPSDVNSYRDWGE